MNKDEVKELISDLSKASKIYYQDMGVSPLTDEEFDDKREYLSSVKKDYPDLFAKGTEGFSLLGDNEVSMGAKTKAEKIVVHKVPMLSLAKAKTENEVKNFLEKAKKAGATNFVLQAKLDGFAVSAEYDNGKLVKLSTRGDGQIGEDISYLIKTHDVDIDGLPTSISYKKNIEVRGEMFLTDSQFKDADNERMKIKGSESFKNSRNACVGIVKKAEKGLGYHVTLTFCSYNIIDGNEYAERTLLDNDGFISVDTITHKEVENKVQLDNFVDSKSIMNSIHVFGVLRKHFDIPTDGVVIKPENDSYMMKKMGFTVHHPISQLAFKYPTPSVVTTIRSISTTVGRTGKLTIIAHVDPVQILGSTVSRATLNNFNWAFEKDVRVGSIVKITKANEIIPFITTVISNEKGSKKIVVPTNCPSCGKKLWYDTTKKEYPPQTLICKNIDCPSRVSYGINHAVSKGVLDIDGLAEATIEALHDENILNDIADIYELTEKELAESRTGINGDGIPKKLGEKRAKHIMEYIEKSKTLPLWRQIIALNIPKIGSRTAKLLEKEFSSIDDILNATPSDFEKISGMGNKTAHELFHDFHKNVKLIDSLKSHGLFQTTAVASGNKLDGLSFSISGKVPSPFESRGKLVEYIEVQGGVFDGSPKKTTTYMIADDNGTSSKIKKAKDFGINFITEEEFTRKFVE